MKKKRIAITAPTGMLGSAVFNELKNDFDLILLYRNKTYLRQLKNREDHTSIQFDIHSIYQDYKKGFPKKTQSPYLRKIIESIGDVDGFINCAGIIKPYALENPEVTFFTNSAFPHILSEVYKEKLIQITTDCVYSGILGAPYDENWPHSPSDLYGLSKSLGEPKENSLVLRTSVIGEELHGFVSLISWLKRQKGEVQGFTNHLWNGITTKEFAKICKKIILKRTDYPLSGLYHIYSNDISKYDLLILLKEKYNLPITVCPTETEEIDRRLKSLYSLNKKLCMHPIVEMVEEL